MSRLEHFPVFALAATALFALEVIFWGAAPTQAAQSLFFGLAIALAPLIQAAHLDSVPSGVGVSIVLVTFFLVFAAIELVVMRFLRGYRARLSWIVRASALLVFAAILFLTPAAAPMLPPMF